MNLSVCLAKERSSNVSENHREGFYARNSNMRQQHAAAAYSETMLVWDLSDGSCTTVRADVRYGQVGRFTHVALLPDGSVMCLSEGDPTLRVWR